MGNCILNASPNAAGRVMPRLVYYIELTAAPLDLAAQTLTVVRMQEFARPSGLEVY